MEKTKTWEEGYDQGVEAGKFLAQEELIAIQNTQKFDPLRILIKGTIENQAYKLGIRRSAAELRAMKSQTKGRIKEGFTIASLHLEQYTN